MVNHHGSTISGGHYTAFCRQRLGWFCFNDTLGGRCRARRALVALTRCTPRSVLGVLGRRRCQPSVSCTSSSAPCLLRAHAAGGRYLLFYVKRAADVVRIEQ